MKYPKTENGSASLSKLLSEFGEKDDQVFLYENTERTLFH